MGSTVSDSNGLLRFSINILRMAKADIQQDLDGHGLACSANTVLNMAARLNSYFRW
jgi:hypothetical protein